MLSIRRFESGREGKTDERVLPQVHLDRCEGV